GRHSLHVFAWSVPVTSVLIRLSPWWLLLPGWARVGAALLTVLSLAIPALGHEKFRHRDPRKVASTSPRALAAPV
ncbi:MAG TPA: hypothetical protein VKT29_04320, partial [Terriglobales bacterium]|nr:hypothetical protein [Terriglobales bacterium]